MAQAESTEGGDKGMNINTTKGVIDSVSFMDMEWACSWRSVREFFPDNPDPTRFKVLTVDPEWDHTVAYQPDELAILKEETEDFGKVLDRIKHSYAVSKGQWREWLTKRHNDERKSERMAIALWKKNNNELPSQETIDYYAARGRAQVLDPANDPQIPANDPQIPANDPYISANAPSPPAKRDIQAANDEEAAGLKAYDRAQQVISRFYKEKGVGWTPAPPALFFANLSTYHDAGKGRRH
jgi:hypothetical protein